RARTGDAYRRWNLRLSVMKIALIVQRYGSEVLGGSEPLCRLLAERLAAQHDVEVLTTCARDYVTWQNEYPEGSDRVRGVTVRRFANSQVRDIEAFNKYSDWIFNNPHDRADEMEGLKQQGPWSPALLEYLKRTHKNYDTLIFYTYLYAPTVLGLQIDPARSILVPTAHDEPPIHLGIYKNVFRIPKGIAYLTEVERTFVTNTFERTAAIEETVGCGVDLPPHHAYPRPAADEAPNAQEGGDAAQESDENSSGTRYQSHVSARGATFRRRHRV